jgi:hypothetical protein
MRDSARRSTGTAVGEVGGGEAGAICASTPRPSLTIWYSRSTRRIAAQPCCVGVVKPTGQHLLVAPAALALR